MEVVEEDGLKTPVLTDDELETPENVPKPKKTPKVPKTPKTSKPPTSPPPAPKKSKKEPAPEPIEAPKMESFSDELDEDEYEEEEIIVRRWSFEGKNYLKDEENNVYDCDTQDVIAKYDPATNELHMQND